MTSAVLRRWSVADVPLLEAKAWRADVEQRLRDGQRMVTLFGRTTSAPAAVSEEGRAGAAGQAGEALVTAVLQTPEGALKIVRARIDLAHGTHALTGEHPALHCFERELHEQTGMRLSGHPWLKPIRFERGGPRALDAYPFYSIDGKEVHEVAVGPIHAGVIEPGAFRFLCLGEQVHHLEIHLGYQHRGVEALLLQGDPRTRAPLVETIAGDSSIGHGFAYCAAIEALADVELDLAIDVPRGVLLELERIAMHLAGLSGLAADVGFLQGAATYGRLRTTAINTTMRLCGSRFGRGAMRPCGLGARLGSSDKTKDAGILTLAELRQNLTLLRTDGAIIDDCFLSARTVRHRLQGVGALSRERAIEAGLVGMAARASGVALDQRSHARGAYDAVPIGVAVESTGDCWARARLRIEEIRHSLTWIERALESYPRWTAVRRPVPALAPGRLVVSVVEGWRGEIVHALETDETGALAHYKVQDPSLRNWLGLALAVRENEISDFPICNKSFDLSYCGNDL